MVFPLRIKFEGDGKLEKSGSTSESLDFGVFTITREYAWLFSICLIMLAVRFAMINLNHAEYSDGIIQLTYFPNPTLLWPPLYPLICKFLSYTYLDIETCGKLISIISSVAIFIPIYFIGRLLAGHRGAMLSVLVYATQPIAWRWSIRVMTDSLYVLVFTSSLALLLVALNEIERQTLFKLRAFVDRKKLEPHALLSLSILMGTLSGLTRYTAIILIPLQLYAIYRIYKSPGKKVLLDMTLPLLALLSWLIVFNLLSTSGHEQQIVERAGEMSPVGEGWRAVIQSYLRGFFSAKALTSYLNVGESFVYLFPYFVTPPVFFIMIWGWIQLFRGDSRFHKEFTGISLYLFLITIVMQTIFQSFQSRYLLPLIPLVSILAGVAFARWLSATIREGSRGKKNWVYVIVFLILFNAASWSTAVLVLQRGMWGDIHKAGEYMKTLPITERTQIFSNEVYHQPRSSSDPISIYAVKFPFWAGLSNERIQPLFENFRLPEGCYVILHSSYGGPRHYKYIADELYKNYKVRKLAEFHDRIVPLFPDVMESPGTHQNPGAWFLRYFPQEFSTTIFYIEKSLAGR